MWIPVFINNKTNRIILFTYRYLFDVPVRIWNTSKILNTNISEVRYVNRVEFDIAGEVTSFDGIPYWTLDAVIDDFKKILIPIFSSQKQKSLLKNFYNSSPELLNAIKRGEMIA